MNSESKIISRYMNKQAFETHSAMGTWKVAFTTKSVTPIGDATKRIDGVFVLTGKNNLMISVPVTLIFEVMVAKWVLTEVQVQGVTSGRVEILFEMLVSPLIPAILNSLGPEE